MKVLFLTRKWPPAVGGMEIYCRELTRELQSRIPLELRPLPGRADGRPPSVPALLFYAIATAFDLLRRGPRAEIVHGGDLAVWPLVWLARLRDRDTRTVLSAHGTDIALAHRTGAVARLYRLYVQCAVRALPAVTVLANSGATARLCETSGFRDVRIVTLATRMGESAPVAPEPYVLFAGRLMRQKGCAWFIDQVLPLLDPALTLVVAGVIWDSEEGLALRHPRVTFRGPAFGSELARLRANATAIIVPNLVLGTDSFEGFGLTAVEGAADGGVVLAARVYGLADAVRDGETGFLLPSGDAGAWAAKINAVARWSAAERAAFVERARAGIARDYCWERVADETLDAYRQSDEGPAPVDAAGVPGPRRKTLFRTVALICALVGFVVALGWALVSVPHVWNDVAYAPLALLLFVAIPAAVALNAAEFRAIVAAGGARVSWRAAFEMSVYTSAANMLPFPGGVITRLGGMKARGIGVRRSAWLILLFAGIALGGSLAVSGAAIVPRQGLLPLGAGFLVLSAVVLAFSAVGLRRNQVSYALIGQIALIRGGLLVAEAVRIILAVRALGTVLAPMDAAVFSISSFVGTLISIVPTGLGLTEGMVALLSPIIGLAPALGFLSAAINRVVTMVGLAGLALLLLTLPGRGIRSAAQPAATGDKDAAPSV